MSFMFSLTTVQVKICYLKSEKKTQNFPIFSTNAENEAIKTYKKKIG